MTKRRKILVFAHEQYLNGASYSLLAILKGLKSEYEFLVIVPDYGMMVNELKKMNIKYEVINLPRCAYFNWVSGANHLKKIIQYYTAKIKNEKQLLLVVKKFDPDIFYSNTSVVDYGYNFGKKLGKPNVWHIREYSDKYFDIQYLPSKKSVIRKIKGSDVSVFTTNLLKERWLGNKKFNSKVVYNGVSRNKKLDVTTNINNKERVIAVVGSIIEPKNQELALKIFKESYEQDNRLRLNFYGSYDLEYHKKLKRYIQDNQLNEAVSFLGYMPNSKIYNNIDVLLSCSNNEGFGRTIVEAMINKIPVLSKNIGGPSEILKSLKEFSLFESKKEAVIKLNKLMENSDFYISSSKKAYKIAESTYSLESYLRNMDSIFKNLLDEL